MGSLGEKLISGIVWIIISVGIGFWGTSLSESSGFVGILGWIISFIGFGFAVMSASHLFKLVSYHRKGVQMKEENPEAFEKLRKEYEEASKRTQQDDIYEVLSDLNKCLNKAAKLGQNINIREGKDQKCQCFSANFSKTSVKETEIISNLKSQILALIKKLNKKLKEAKDRNLDVSIDLRYWGPEKMKEAGQSQPYKYHFSASITNERDSDPAKPTFE